MKLSSIQKSIAMVLFCGLPLLGLSLPAHSTGISQKIELLNIEAEADYLKGDSDKAAVLIIHGFLTTNKFHTVQAMAKSLHEEGYNVLSPTLTLNITKRKNSIKCNSVHTHTLENDVIEIEDWINWLREKGHQKIVVLGHSSGSQEILEYLMNRPQHNVDAAIFTSLFYLNGKELGTQEAELQYARSLIEKNIDRPKKYSFLFCKNNYFATPQSFLSYMKLNRSYVLESMKKLDIPSYTIMGSADKRYLSVGKNWLDELENTGTKMITVEGANHFFSSEHEFDLQDNLVEIMQNLSN